MPKVHTNFSPNAVQLQIRHFLPEVWRVGNRKTVTEPFDSWNRAATKLYREGCWLSLLYSDRFQGVLERWGCHVLLKNKLKEISRFDDNILIARFPFSPVSTRTTPKFLTYLRTLKRTCQNLRIEQMKRSFFKANLMAVFHEKYQFSWG